MMEQPRFPLTTASSPVLQTLVRDLIGALARGREPQPERLIAALGKATAAGAWLPHERRRANHERYARHLIYADPRGQFSVLAIVWAPGQVSPIHNHRTWTNVAVYQGVLTETSFELPRGKTVPEATRQEILNQGTTSFDDTGRGIHQLGNHGKQNAISLHVYGVGGGLVSTGINHIYNRGKT